MNLKEINGKEYLVYPVFNHGVQVSETWCTVWCSTVTQPGLGFTEKIVVELWENKSAKAIKHKENHRKKKMQVLRQVRSSSI